MACLLTQGFTLGCKTESAGIKSIWLVEWNTSDTITAASGEVTAHTLASARAYFAWEFEKETSSMEFGVMPSAENGAVAYEADVNIKVFGITTAKRNEIKLLAKNRLRMLVLDNEGVYWMLGKDFGVQLQDSKLPFGTAFSDHKGANLVFKHRETDLPMVVQSSVITGLSLP